MPGLLGWRGQGMDGRKPGTPTLAEIIDVRSGSYTTTADYWADIFAWGGGGVGNSDATTPSSGGGGAAGWSRLLLPRGSSLSWAGSQPMIGAAAGVTSGTNGLDTTVTVNGVVMTAQGGRFGSTSTVAGRSFATGFQVGRYGGGAGEAGEFGGSGGASVGGGGAGGFRDLFPGLTGGNGAASTSSSGAQTIPDYGGGGGAQTNGTQFSTWGGEGRVMILLHRI